MASRLFSFGVYSTTGVSSPPFWSLSIFFLTSYSYSGASGWSISIGKCFLFRTGILKHWSIWHRTILLYFLCCWFSPLYMVFTAVFLPTFTLPLGESSTIGSRLSLSRLISSFFLFIESFMVYSNSASIDNASACSGCTLGWFSMA